jgi:hypothetical protein
MTTPEQRYCGIAKVGTSLMCALAPGHSGKCEFRSAHELPSGEVRRFQTPEEFFGSLAKFRCVHQFAAISCPTCNTGEKQP